MAKRSYDKEQHGNHLTTHQCSWEKSTMYTMYTIKHCKFSSWNLICLHNWTYFHSRNKFWALWHGPLFCCKSPYEDLYTVVGLRGGQQQYQGRMWHLKDSQLVLWGLKCAKKPLHHNQQPQTVDLCFDIVCPKFSPEHLNVAAEIKTTGQNHLLLSSLGESCES